MTTLPPWKWDWLKEQVAAGEGGMFVGSSSARGSTSPSHAASLAISSAGVTSMDSFHRDAYQTLSGQTPWQTKQGKASTRNSEEKTKSHPGAVMSFSAACDDLASDLPSASFRHLTTSFLLASKCYPKTVNHADATPTNKGDTPTTRTEGRTSGTSEVFHNLPANLKAGSDAPSQCFGPEYRQVWMEDDPRNCVKSSPTIMRKIRKCLGPGGQCLANTFLPDCPRVSCATTSEEGLCAKCTRHTLFESLSRPREEPTLQVFFKGPYRPGGAEAPSTCKSHSSLWESWVGMQLRRETEMMRCYLTVISSTSPHLSDNKIVDSKLLTSMDLCESADVSIDRFQKWYRESVVQRLPEKWRSKCIQPQYQFVADRNIKWETVNQIHLPGPNHAEVHSDRPSNVLIVSGVVTSDNLDAISYFTELTTVLAALSAAPKQGGIAPTPVVRQKIATAPSARAITESFKIYERRLESREEITKYWTQTCLRQTRRDAALRLMSIRHNNAKYRGKGWARAGTLEFKNSEGGFQVCSPFMQDGNGWRKKEHYEDGERLIDRKTALLQHNKKLGCSELLCVPIVADKADIYITAPTPRVLNALISMFYLLRASVAMECARIGTMVLQQGKEIDLQNLAAVINEEWAKYPIEQEEYEDGNLSPPPADQDDLWAASYDDVFFLLGRPFGPAIEVLWRMALKVRAADQHSKSIQAAATLVNELWRGQGGRTGLKFLEYVEHSLFSLGVGSFQMTQNYLEPFIVAWNATASKFA